MGHSSWFSYSAVQYIRKSLFLVEIPAQFPEHPRKKLALWIGPSRFVMIEFIHEKGSDPLVEIFGLIDVSLDIFPSLWVVKAIMFLGIAEIPEHIFCVLGVDELRKEDDRVR